MSLEGLLREGEVLAYLEGVRRGLIRTIVVLLLLGIVIFPFSKGVLRLLYESNLDIDLIADPHQKVTLVAFAIPEAFFSLIKLTLFASIFCSIPFLLYQLWRVIEPLLRNRGVRHSAFVLVAAIILFYAGAFFCYFVTLPFGVKFLLGYQSPTIRPMISVGQYISFCSAFIFGFGLTFELPLILAILGSVGLVNAAFLSRNRGYAVILIAIVAAVVTPTPDVFNMALMGVPLYLLFETGVMVVKVMEIKKRKRSSPS